jgi:diguanylate cyclase (GGDEF)-like protein/PAS domain S-box-containing protein
MTSPLSASARGPISGLTAAERRHKLARKWAYLVSLTAYLPLPHAEIEAELLELVNRLFEAATSEPVPVDRVGRIGARLVELNCVGKASLLCTVDALAGALLSDPELRRFDRLPERVAHVLGAVASGYADAIRVSTMEQQDNLHRALLEVIWTSERNLRISESRLDEVLTHSASGIAITTLDGHFVRVNAAFDRIVDRGADGAAGASLFDLVRARGGLDLREAYQELLDGRLERLELCPELVCHNGKTTTVSLVASLLRDPDGEATDYVTLVVEDFERPAPHDDVTGLPNRDYLISRLARVLDEAKPTTLYQLELDGFEVLTGGLDQEVVEQLLRAVARRLVAVVADTQEATVAYFGGGAFTILVESSPTAPDTVTVIKKINRALAKPVRIGELRVPTSTSIGVAHQLSRDADPAELLRAADLALRRATSRGCGQWALFDPERDARDQAGLVLAATMPGAWDNGQLRVVYRSILRLADERVLGTEALLRWDHPLHGSIPHQRCQDLAEHTGLILTLGSRMLRRACEHIRLRPDARLCVDLTANQAGDRDLVGRVLRVIEEAGLPPTRLQLGVPMSALRADHGGTDNVRGLAGVGVSLAVHHFHGTPEDLAYLDELPISVARLAPSLVQRQAKDADPVSLMAKAVIDLIGQIHLAGASVTVDDLQTRVQVNWWHQSGADSATGPVFAQLL